VISAKPELPPDTEVYEITDRTVIILRVPKELPMEFKDSPLFGISQWCKSQGVNPLMVLLPEGAGLHMVSEVEMAKYGWYRKESEAGTQK